MSVGQFTASEGETAGERRTREGLRRWHGGKRRGGAFERKPINRKEKKQELQERGCVGKSERKAMGGRKSRTGRQWA